jgi:hypothetical protein
LNPFNSGLHCKGLCCSWSCLHFRGLCCIWMCLHHRGRSCTLTCLYCRGLSFSWRCLHYRGLSCILTCLRLRSLCCTWRCLHHKGQEPHLDLSTLQGPELSLERLVLVLDSIREIRSIIPRCIYFEILTHAECALKKGPCMLNVR